MSADPTDDRGDGRTRGRGRTDGDGRRPNATDATLLSHLVLPGVLPNIPHVDDDCPRDHDDRDHGSHGILYCTLLRARSAGAFHA